MPVSPADDGACTQSISAARRSATLGVVAAMCVAAALVLWGIRGDLPWCPEVDELRFVSMAAKVASGESSLPGWYGHPGSTTVYPLAGIFLVQWQVLRRTHGAAETMVEDLGRDPSPYFMSGRLLGVAMLLGCVPLAYVLGRRLGGRGAGLLAAWLVPLSPLLVSHTQMVRTDTASALVMLLFTWRLARVCERSSRGNLILAGVCAGLAVSTKWYLAVLPLMLFLVELALLRSVRAGGGDVRRARVDARLGLIAAAVTFALTTPGVFLEPLQAARNLNLQLSGAHLGHDGLSPIGNLWFYLTDAILHDLGWAQAIMAIAAVLAVARFRSISAPLLVSLVIAFLLVICVSGQHWSRWAIPVLPLCTILASAAAWRGVCWLLRRRQGGAVTHLLTGIAVFVILAAEPGWRSMEWSRSRSRPSTRVAAGQWIAANVPAGSVLAQEWYCAPLGPSVWDTEAFDLTYRFETGGGVRVLECFSLGERRMSLAGYRAEGFTHLVTSSAISERYQSGDHADAAAFYRALTTGATLVHEAAPTAERTGPTVCIYELR